MAGQTTDTQKQWSPLPGYTLLLQAHVQIIQEIEGQPETCTLSAPPEYTLQCLQTLRLVTSWGGWLGAPCVKWVKNRGSVKSLLGTGWPCSKLWAKLQAMLPATLE